jgi:hypothetical protein
MGRAFSILIVLLYGEDHNRRRERSQESIARKQKAEGRKQKAEGRKQKAESRRRDT